MEAALCFTAELPSVEVRRRPALGSDKVSTLQKGDEIIAAEVIIEEGIEWVKLAKGSTALRSHGVQKQVPLDLFEEGFVATAVPSQGRQLRKHTPHERPVRSMEPEPQGILSKAEINEVLGMSTDPGLQLPLEVKFWTRQQLEMFVMSGGVLRPKNCSIPDERLLANTKMSKEEVVHSLSQAAEWITSADAILIGSGAGMGVDSGLGTFRGGKKGVWDGLEAVGLAYEEICEPRWFDEASGEPRLAWGFWNHCYSAYQETKPHQGYTTLRQMGQRCPFGFFSFTSNIDSHWIASGMSADRVLEVHGAVRWLQCSKPCCPDVWKAPNGLCLHEDSTHRAQGILPVCPKCKAVARPNVQMFGGDSGFSRARRGAQNAKYDAWINRMAEQPDSRNLRVVCLEIGCGLTVPTVRKELEKVVQKFPEARLIRINPENPGLASELVSRGVSLPLPAGAAIEQLSKQVAQLEETMQATYILWGRDGGCEFQAPFGTCVGRLLRLARTQAGMTLDCPKDVKVTGKQAIGGKTEDLILERSVPMDLYQEVKLGEGSEQQVTAILKVEASFKNGSHNFGGYSLNATLAKRVEQVCQLLDEVNVLFSDPSYQSSVKMCEDRRSVIKAARTVQFQVLPKYGIEATEKGTSIMAAWIGSSQNGIREVDEKVAISMDKSYVLQMAHLPLVKASPVKPGSAPASNPVATPPVAAAWQGYPPQEPTVKHVPKAKPVPKAKEEKPPQPLTVTVTRFATWEDPEPQRLRIDLMSNTKVSELRSHIAKLCDLDDKAARRAKLIKRKKAGFVTAEDMETVTSDMFVHNIDQWPGD
eukprot:TRINITY_DN21556_c0_g1_i1.p1 TRINITY_DN21556_c0_g1~~TRINITY_DN21556_c0_g1_i1.p1  ORF type:complete len:815 (+),score=142.97 TRINITY_DN21556_c0_g1_i1:166-2610(+)